MKKQRLHNNNRRRKKTRAQRKAAYARCVASMCSSVQIAEDMDIPFCGTPEGRIDKWLKAGGLEDGLLRHTRQLGDERQFLKDAMQPFEAAIVQALIPHYRAVFDGEDPADSPDAVGYAVDLIWDSGGEGEDSLAAAICAVYHAGAEAALPHLERAIQWHSAFEARQAARAA
jgi:hypothetical protein